MLARDPLRPLTVLGRRDVTGTSLRPPRLRLLQSWVRWARAKEADMTETDARQKSKASHISTTLGTAPIICFLTTSYTTTTKKACQPGQMLMASRSRSLLTQRTVGPDASTAPERLARKAEFHLAKPADSNRRIGNNHGVPAGSFHTAFLGFLLSGLGTYDHAVGYIPQTSGRYETQLPALWLLTMADIWCQTSAKGRSFHEPLCMLTWHFESCSF